MVLSAGKTSIPVKVLVRFGGRGAEVSNLFLLGNASLFTTFWFTIFVPLEPPPPNQQNDGFPLEFLLKGPQTELRTLSQNCEQTPPPKIANKQNYEQTGVSDLWAWGFFEFFP